MMNDVSVKAPVQTSEQLAVSNATLLWRGITTRCPACGEWHTHERFAKLRPSCPRCSLKFERIFGHSLGYIGINTVVTFSLTFVVVLVGTFLRFPDPPGSWLLWAALATAASVPIVFLRPAHTVWTAMDLIMRPLTPGEIDPRFVKVDPEAGTWLDEA